LASEAPLMILQINFRRELPARQTIFFSEPHG
jgi:hypothetical protein